MCVLFIRVGVGVLTPLLFGGQKSLAHKMIVAGACTFAFGTAFSTACCPAAGAADVTQKDTRIGRPTFRLDLAKGLIAAEPNREPIAEAAQSPGIYRGFLIWRQKFAHLAICKTDLCNGSCIAYGDACLVCAQSPVLPLLLTRSGSSFAACASGCDPRYNDKQVIPGASCCEEGGCH